MCRNNTISKILCLVERAMDEVVKRCDLVVIQDSLFF
jgi:hypothetical protein